MIKLLLIATLAIQLHSQSTKNIQTELKQCYEWNPRLWDGIIKNDNIDYVVDRIFVMCNPRFGKNIKKEYNIAKKANNLNSYYNLVYNEFIKISNGK